MKRIRFSFIHQLHVNSVFSSIWKWINWSISSKRKWIAFQFKLLISSFAFMYSRNKGCTANVWSYVHLSLIKHVTAKTISFPLFRMEIIPWWRFIRETMNFKMQIIIQISWDKPFNLHGISRCVAAGAGWWKWNYK